jgi:hypothetical protein
MYRSNHLPCARRAHGLRTAVRFAGLLASLLLAACEPEPAPEPTPPVIGTSPYTLKAGVPESEQPPEATAVRAELTSTSHFGGNYYRYDAFIVTATQSGAARLRSDVLQVKEGAYPYGYGYPLSIAAIEGGVELAQLGGTYVQDALESGTAIVDYPVVEGRQYIVVYKTFDGFAPLTYRLTLPASLKLEGRIDTLPEPVPVTAASGGAITLENPQPQALQRFVDHLDASVSRD